MGGVRNSPPRIPSPRYISISDLCVRFFAVALIYVPFLQDVFGTAALGALELLILGRSRSSSGVRTNSAARTSGVESFAR